jgi:hypothetical protein
LAPPYLIGISNQNNIVVISHQINSQQTLPLEDILQVNKYRYSRGNFIKALAAFEFIRGIFCVLTILHYTVDPFISKYND